MSPTRISFRACVLVMTMLLSPVAGAGEPPLAPPPSKVKELQDAERLRLDMAAAAERVSVELDLPSYLGRPLPPVRFWIAGRTLLITPTDGSRGEPAAGTLGLERRRRDDLALLGVRQVPAEARERGFAVELPRDLVTDFYVLRFELENRPVALPLEVRATGLPVHHAGAKTEAFSADPVVSHIKRLGCGFCYWESVLWIDPADESFGYFAGGGGSDYLVQTTDGWVTPEVLSINQLTDPRTAIYRGDPKFEMTADGELALTSLLTVPGQGPTTGGFYLDRAPMNVPPDFSQTLLRPIPPDLPPEIFLIFDYPKIAIDKDPSSQFFDSIYVFANAVRFDDGTRGTGLYTIRDGVIQESKATELGFLQPPQSAEVGPGGVLYQARDDGPVRHFYRSTDGAASFVESVLVSTDELNACGSARTSSTSTESWGLFRGPKLAIDHASGRLYVAWAQYVECVEHPEAEFFFYARDYDVYVAYSDDQGATWSSPLRVNDDASGGDQGFPDIAVDTDGTVYVAFLDHRDRQDQPVYDVYFAMSSDRGASFSRNVKINDMPVPNVLGGRDPGDYLDMIGIGSSKVFIGHPCVAEDGGDGFRPSDACIAVLPKPITLTGPGDACEASEQTACLLGGKFRVRGTMKTFDDPPVSVATRVMTFGGGRAESDQAVFFESFNAGNFEAGVKMVDACGLEPGHPLRAYWAFFGALTNAETALTIRDMVTGATYDWFNPAGELPRAKGDTGAFPCSVGTPTSPCEPGENRACLLAGRFQVEGTMKDFAQPPVEYPVRVMTFPGDGRAESEQAVFFESFQSGNFEVGVKMVDACGLEPDHPLRAYWVFYGALSNAETEIEVTQISTGLIDRWTSPAGEFPLTESRTNALPCETPGS